ncbi:MULTISPECIES: TetR/AcrR family transcriptional regulator [unclassified Ensifer]|uniref:TetR/AcrR family transcriptional regulator n=1 Tax=unclassified Ensifer TaxID=2633371 RepID=UPI0008138DB1|nr:MULTISPECIES: TetR/AcrR family transcriptional regulator [unclassified Ensifer]OCP17515.1 TetR family transcriptional regulator [Ensifer sp. LC54]OCP28580.1 TetR family transcriptional regulator [Ensifer sp. LC384]
MSRVVAERQDVITMLAEIFREHGYDGASLSLITEKTGLGKGSLYHFFPRGKEEMAEAVLGDIASWFQTNIFNRLRNSEPPAAAIDDMFASVDSYFRQGRRLCLMGVIATSGAHDRFSAEINRYFADWRTALAEAFGRQGIAEDERKALAEEVIGGIQGALILARSLGDPQAFGRVLTRLKARCTLSHN